MAIVGIAQAAANYLELACPDGGEALVQAPDELAVHRILLSERDAVLARSLHAAAERAAAQGPNPGSGPRAPCVIGVVGCSHLPGIARQWPRAGLPDGDRSGHVPSTAGGGARRVRADVWGGGSPAGGASGRAPGSSQACAGQPHDQAAPARASASGHSSSCAERGGAGAAAATRHAAPDAPGVALGAEGSPAEHADIAHSMAARAAHTATSSPDKYRGEALGVRRALLERLIDLMALPEVAADLRAALPVLAPGAASAAHADALELYGAPRMLLACLTREQLALVRHTVVMMLSEGRNSPTVSMEQLCRVSAALKSVQHSFCCAAWCPAVQL